jgi:hypothetical protein
MKTNFTMFIILVFMSPSIKNQAQDVSNNEEQIIKSIIDTRLKSDELVRNYTWTMRTEVLKQSEVLNILIEKAEYDQNGQVVYKTLNQQGEKMPTGFLIKRIAEDEKENLEKFLYGMRDFLHQYSLPGSEAVIKFITGASWTMKDSDKEILFTHSDVIVPGDKLNWFVNVNGYTTSRIEVITKFEGDVVNFTAVFVTLPNGLNYMSYAEALVPAKNITLQIQKYDYMPD